MDLSEQSKRGREPEDQSEEVRELTEKADEKRRRFDVFDQFRSELDKPAFRFGLADARRPAVQAGERLRRSAGEDASRKVLQKAADQRPCARATN